MKFSPILNTSEIVYLPTDVNSLDVGVTKKVLHITQTHKGGKGA